MKWELWANEKNELFYHVGSKAYVKLHHSSYPMVPVVVVEDINGTYWGWADPDRDIPSMIWHHESLFSMCFPHGYRASEEAGNGRHVRLSITASQTEKP